MWCDCDIVMILLLRGCLGAGESVGLPLYQLSPPETPQPGGRAGQAGAGPHQQEGADPGEEQSRICRLPKVIRGSSEVKYLHSTRTEFHFAMIWKNLIQHGF